MTIHKYSDSFITLQEFWNTLTKLTWFTITVLGNDTWYVSHRTTFVKTAIQKLKFHWGQTLGSYIINI